jgi:hypothetical protein
VTLNVSNFGKTSEVFFPAFGKFTYRRSIRVGLAHFESDSPSEQIQLVASLKRRSQVHLAKWRSVDSLLSAR